MHTSVAIPGTVEFLDITQINPLISKCKIKVCYVGDEANRNKSIITEDSARIIAQSLPGSPIVGYYNEQKGDFESHNHYFVFQNGKIQMKTNTRPYGFVDINAKVWFEEYLDDNTDRRKYMVTEGYVWTGQYPEAQSVVEGSGNPHSLEFSEDERYLDAFWTKDGNGNNQFFIVNEAVIANLCILGKDVEPCFEGSNITQFSFEPEFKNTMFNLIEEMKNILNNDKGGIAMAEEKVVSTTTDDNEGQVTDTQVVDYEKKKEEETKIEDKKEDTKVEDKKEEKPEDDKEGKDDDEKKKKTQYNLDEIPEYVALKAEFDNLQTQYSALETATNDLKSFKETVEKKEKQELIKSFYMLSDEDKKDVTDNIMSYSYDEIKSKLSVICVDKRVSFEKIEEDVQDTKQESKQALTYNLDDAQDTSDSGKPAWLKRVDKQIKK